MLSSYSPTYQALNFCSFEETSVKLSPSDTISVHVHMWPWKRWTPQSLVTHQGIPSAFVMQNNHLIPWIIDFGASNHMTDIAYLHNFSPWVTIIVVWDRVCIFLMSCMTLNYAATYYQLASLLMIRIVYQISLWCLWILGGDFRERWLALLGCTMACICSMGLKSSNKQAPPPRQVKSVIFSKLNSINFASNPVSPLAESQVMLFHFHLGH